MRKQKVAFVQSAPEPLFDVDQILRDYDTINGLLCKMTLFLRSSINFRHQNCANQLKTHGFTSLCSWSSWELILKVSRKHFAMDVGLSYRLFASSFFQSKQIDLEGTYDNLIFFNIKQRLHRNLHLTVDSLMKLRHFSGPISLAIQHNYGH